MNPIVVQRTANGWIVTEDAGYMSQADIEQSHVFETLEGVASFILGEVPPRKKKKKKNGAKTDA